MPGVAGPHYPRRARPSSILPRSHPSVPGGRPVRVPMWRSPRPGAGSGQGRRRPLPKGSVSASCSSAVALGQGEGLLRGPLSRSLPGGSPRGLALPQLVLGRTTAQSLGGSGSRSDFPPLPPAPPTWFPKGQRREVPTPPTHLRTHPPPHPPPLPLSQASQEQARQPSARREVLAPGLAKPWLPHPGPSLALE